MFFDTLELGVDSSPLGTDAEEDAGRQKLMEMALESVKTELSVITGAKITCVAEEANRFLDTLDKYVRNHHIQLVIMGITGSTRLGQIFMGSNTLNLASGISCQSSSCRPMQGLSLPKMSCCSPTSRTSTIPFLKCGEMDTGPVQSKPAHRKRRS